MPYPAGWLAREFAAQRVSQRRLEVREVSLDNVAAAKTAALAAAAVAAAAAVGGSAARPHTQAREGQGQEAQAGSACGLFVGPALGLEGRRVSSQMPRLYLMWAACAIIAPGGTPSLLPASLPHSLSSAHVQPKGNRICFCARPQLRRMRMN